MWASIKFLIRPGKFGAAERGFARLGEILGADIAEIALPQDGPVGGSFVSDLLDAQALVSSAETLTALFKRSSGNLASLDSLASHLRSVLIYGLERCSPESARLLFGTDAIVTGCPSSRSANHCYHLSRAGSGVSQQLAGISFEAEASSECVSPSADETGGGAGTNGGPITRIIDCDGMPWFGSLNRGECEIFQLASSDLLDVDASAMTGELSPQAYPALLPWLLFIRRAAGNRCWRNPAPRACLIVDDPLLRPRYGFLSFVTLVESMRLAEFTTTIAFIPWNWARSEASTSLLFRQNASMLSLCVHGCDHTGGEFSSTEIEVLRQKAHTALERMRLHEHRNRVQWDRVMVFPQGVFSSASLVALGREGYLAAVNSGISSIDCPENNRVADLLAPASQAYGGVPLFKRHYPKDLLPFALDLFLGKQVLVAEHHTYFRSGYRDAATFAAQLKTVEPGLSWSPLGQTLRSAVQHRVTASGNELRAYTDEVLFSLPEHESDRCRLIKYEADPASVSAVMVNGHEVECRFKDDRIEVEFEARGECRVDVLRRPTAPSRTDGQGFGYSARVAARRYLSELRDDSLVANTRSLATTIARRIGRVF